MRKTILNSLVAKYGKSGRGTAQRELRFLPRSPTSFRIKTRLKAEVFLPKVGTYGSIFAQPVQCHRDLKLETNLRVFQRDFEYLFNSLEAVPHRADMDAE